MKKDIFIFTTLHIINKLYVRGCGKGVFYMSFVIIADSASNLNSTLAKKYGIEIISFHYTVDGEEYLCYADENFDFENEAKKYYTLLREGKIIKTSLVSIQDYCDIFEKHLKKGEDILSISISGNLSGSLNSSINARDIVLEKYPDRKIVCLDSLNASFGEAMSAIMASKARDEGKSLEETVDLISPVRMNFRSEFVVDKLTYLARGGRISPIVASIGNLLDIKPLLRASADAKIESFCKVRGKKKAILKLVETVKENIIDPENQTVYIAHCDDIVEANALKDLLLKFIPNIKNISIHQYDLCSGGHVGPSALAIFYYGKSRLEK